MIVAVFFGLVLVGVACWAAAGVLWVRRSNAPSAEPSSPRRSGVSPLVGRRLAGGALLVALVVAAVVLFAPMGSSSTVSATADGSSTVSTTESVRLIDEEGVWLVLLVAVPVGLAGLAAVVRGRRERSIRLACGGMLLLACLVGIATLGLFFLPIAIVVVVAGASTPPAQRSAEADRHLPAASTS